MLRTSVRAWVAMGIITSLMVGGVLAGGVRAQPDITIEYAPVEVAPGTAFSVRWSVQGSGVISHTNVHWGTGPGSSIADYPNTGRVMNGSAPAVFNDTSLRSPLAPGMIYLRIHLVMGEEYISSEFTITVTPLINVTRPNATLIAYPEKGVSPGDTYSITWEIVGGTYIDHTNVHWGVESERYPNEAPAFNSTSPQVFTSVLTAPTTDTKVYFIIHFVVDSVNYYTPERSFVVGKSPDPEVVSMSYPSEVDAGGDYTVSWRIEGGIPGQITLTRVVWGTEPRKLTEYGEPLSGHSPQDFSTTLTAPTDATAVFFAIHYVVDGSQHFTPERRINVTGTPRVTLRILEPPPANIPTGREFTVSWVVEGGNTVELTRFEWGFEKGLHTERGNEFYGVPGQRFTDIIRAPNTTSRVYYVVYYKVDGLEFTSEESSFFVYEPGSALNPVTLSVIIALLVITILLAYLILTSSRAEDRKKGDVRASLTDARRASLEYLTGFYKVPASRFRLHDAYTAGDGGYEVVYRSPGGRITYRLYVDPGGDVVRFTGGRAP